MSPSRRILLGLLTLGLQAGIAAAQTLPAKLPPVGTTPMTTTPAAIAPTTITASQPVVPAEPTILIPSADPFAVCGTDRSGIIGGVGLFVMQPFFQNNPAYNVLMQSYKPGPVDPTKPTGITTGIAVDRVNVSHSIGVAPLVWLGYIGADGLGARARYWTFQQGTSQTASLPPFNGTYLIKPFKDPITGETHPTIDPQTGTQMTITSATPLGLQAFGDDVSLMHGPEATNFTVTTQLAIQVADLELLQDFRAGQYDFLLVGGVRLARINQTYNAYDAQSTSAAELRSLLSSYNFAGAGPTVALEMRRRIRSSGFSLYGSGRGSLVFGGAQQNAFFGGQELRNDDPNPQAASEHRTRGLAIAELETGVEYGQSLGRSWLFGQVGLVGMEWFNAGNASRSNPATPSNSPNPAIGGAPVDSNIAFFGLMFRVGLNY